MPKFRNWSALALVALVVASSGCSTFRGAPTALLDPKDTESNTNNAFVNAKTELRTLATTVDMNVRNAAMLKLMALADVRYMHFRNDIVSARKNTRAAANSLLLMTDVAATLTESIGVKDNYIALSALISGGENIYDKEYLLDRTIDALVAQMDANRKARQVEIYRRLEDPIDRYPSQAAVASLLDYYYAGTLNGALIGVQQSAADQERRSDAELRILNVSQIAARRSDTERIADFVETVKNDADLLKLRSFLLGHGVAVPEFLNEMSIVDRQIAIKQGFSMLRDEKEEFADYRHLSTALKDIGFTLP